MPVAFRKRSGYRVYCDESNTDSHKPHPVYGAILVALDDIREVHSRESGRMIPSRARVETIRSLERSARNQKSPSPSPDVRGCGLRGRPLPTTNHQPLTTNH
jgi:hypothetical protein